MRRRLFGLRAKFMALIAVILIIIFATVGFVLLRTSINTLRSNLVFQTRAFAELATDPIGETYIDFRETGLIRIRQVIQSFTDLDPNISNVMIVDIEGNILYSQNSDPETVSISSEDATSFQPLYEYDQDGDISRAIVPYFEQSGVRRYSVVYDVSDETISDSISQQIIGTSLFSLLGLIVSISIMYALINYLFIEPLQRLSRQAMAISAGNLRQQVYLERQDEVGDLAQAVNDMAGSLRNYIKELEAADQLKTEFLIITSHNLRTPLTIIKGYLEEALSIKTPPKLKNMLEEINLASKRLSNFSEDILAIAHIEAGRSVGSREVIKVEDFIQRTVDTIPRQAEEKGVEFELDDKAADARVYVNKSLISGAVWNLLDNALKFTSKGDKIRLTTAIRNEKVEIAVSDTGIGISTAEVEKLFTKFHRGTGALTYDYEGLGIGLYAARLVVREHGGEVRVESKLGEGSTFTIILPLAKGDEQDDS